MKRLGFYHSKDMDGFFSGAVLKKRFPDITLLGWDYKDEVPNINDLTGYDEVILIDITFPFETLQEYGEIIKIIVIDHHISFYNETVNKKLNFKYIYDSEKSACEIGSKYYLGYIGPVLKLVGAYDTWRDYGTSYWGHLVLPTKYFLESTIETAEGVSSRYTTDYINLSSFELRIGESIKDYVERKNRILSRNYSFTKKVYGCFEAICINTSFFNSEMLSGFFDNRKHDLMIGFCYTGDRWSVSLRSEGDLDVSEIAKKRGGGGHKNAAGFEVKTFEEIFI